MQFRSVTSKDRDALAKFITDRWGCDYLVSKMKIYHAQDLDAFICEEDGKIIACVTYYIEGAECEIVSLDSIRPGEGLGRQLMSMAEDAARSAGCTKVWLMTTNDNTYALRLFQRLGYSLCEVHLDEVKRYREIKPCIPLKGNDGIPIRDLFELEKQIR